MLRKGEGSEYLLLLKDLADTIWAYRSYFQKRIRPFATEMRLSLLKCMFPVRTTETAYNQNRHLQTQNNTSPY